MSFWSVMNWVAWGLCGVIVMLLSKDFIKVEIEQAAKKKLDLRAKESAGEEERANGTRNSAS